MTKNNHRSPDEVYEEILYSTLNIAIGLVYNMGLIEHPIRHDLNPSNTNPTTAREPEKAHVLAKTCSEPYHSTVGKKKKSDSISCAIPRANAIATFPPDFVLRPGQHATVAPNKL